jgi:diacylglycerol kinase (ATP)
LSECNNKLKKLQNFNLLEMKASFMKTAILINLSANAGAASNKWESSKNNIMSFLPPGALILETGSPYAGFTQKVDNLIQDGYNCFISGGGDGSTNHLLNTIVSLKKESVADVYIGAIGLGSSNDFLKRKNSLFNSIPARINTNNFCLADVGKVCFSTVGNCQVTKYFIANASVGVVSDANYTFNQGDFFIDRFKSRAVDIAILYTALKTILRYKNKKVEIEYSGCRKEVFLTNLSLIKTPHVSGSFQYDQDIQENDGYLGLNYCFDLNTIELLGLLNDLGKKRFSGKKKRISEFVHDLKVFSGDYLNLELDGEVYQAKDISFSIIPNAINILGS